MFVLYILILDYVFINLYGKTHIYLCTFITSFCITMKLHYFILYHNEAVVKKWQSMYILYLILVSI